jgi:hypothetical protein
LGAEREQESLLLGFCDMNDLPANEKRRYQMKANPCQQVFEQLLDSKEAAKLFGVLCFPSM